ncbi:MAG: hypothetical protein ABS10_04955 [SAR86 cluster bacterium BACL1 MAG-120820-bin45]|jgi:uncharacterized protein|uniref:ChsH2 C-terminal OB-fold domain-containing protein n=2 Tax=SAR86 cluster TaxID=62672 RepID=A0A0R2UC44_9GAMM|nr:MAG: hypothetical protein ABS10_04955 [SAR86 cluster bacterium BACL1 MAG-120820-bin45]KRP09723.1 MAG: hypothetical protein ABS12_03260 [SAR86 cluster bacterium BACL1 MAG-121004-bin11]
MKMSETKATLLKAPFELSYKYKRSSGPIMSQVFEGLAKKKILGSKSKANKVYAPAAEYDPHTREALTELIEVGPGGIIESWSWVHQPSNHHLIQTPFAFALIKLDGADTAMLHMISDCEKSDLAIGNRVKAVWSETPTESIADIQHFILDI